LRGCRQLKQSLLLTRFDDEGLNYMASLLVKTVDARIDYVRRRYERESMCDPELRPIFRAIDPDF
jgi:hypothetical protein